MKQLFHGGGRLALKTHRDRREIMKLAARPWIGTNWFLAAASPR